MTPQKVKRESQGCGSHKEPVRKRLGFQLLKDLKVVFTEHRRISTASLMGRTDIVRRPAPPSTRLQNSNQCIAVTISVSLWLSFHVWWVGRDGALSHLVYQDDAFFLIKSCLQRTAQRALQVVEEAKVLSALYHVWRQHTGRL